jgi:CHAT domain-containing protein
VAGKYPSSTCLLRDAATRAAFIERASAADVLHFAGHAVVNHLNPDESSLLLAGSPADRFTAREIRALPLARTRLVVLSACDTAAGFMTQSQGPLGLSRAFLSAGAQTVVASVWPVDDFASFQLLSRFHDAYKKTGRAEDALREAQLVLSSSNNPQLSDPGRWGAFTVMGRGARGRDGVSKGRIRQP